MLFLKINLADLLHSTEGLQIGLFQVLGITKSWKSENKPFPWLYVQCERWQTGTPLRKTTTSIYCGLQFMLFMHLI